MSLTKDEVKHIAKLARLELTDEETGKFASQLSAILENAKMLDEVNTDSVEPIAQITGLENVQFKDEVNACDYTDELLGQSPNGTEDRMIKVKNVF